MNTIILNEKSSCNSKHSSPIDDPMTEKNSFWNILSALINRVVVLVKRESPVLFGSVVFAFILALICLGGLIIDDRMLMGINVWVKPLKFSISTVIYILTVGYLITLYPYSKRKKWFINGTVAWTLTLELGIIVVQGARGVQSHYNMGSHFDGLAYAAMGLLIGINVIIMGIFLIDTLRLKLKTDKSIQWAILIGWIVVLFGSWVGGQMIGQLAHTVGAADGGEGLPLLNWSTIAGDLRVAHFFGLHAIQIIPLFALGLVKKWNVSNKKRIIAVTIFSMVYIGWLAFTFYQAKQGMALIQM